MTEAEFAAALTSGDDILFDGAEIGAARTLAADWISRALSSGSAVRIENAVIAGVVELADLTVAAPVRLVNCRIDRFNVRSCTFTAPVRIVGSSARAIDVSGSLFERAFVLQDSECEALDVSAAVFLQGFAVSRSTIGRLLNVPGRYSHKRPFAYYLSARYAGSIVRRRPRTVAVAASLVLHLIIALFVSRQHVQPAEESVATVQRLVFERQPAPRPRPRRRTPVAPHRVAVVRPAPPVRAHGASRPVLSPHVVPKSPRVPPSHPQPKGLAKVVPRAVPERRPVLSDARLAQIENGLRSAIASDRGRVDPLAGTSAAPAAFKHYGVDAASLGGSDRRHRGLCDPIRDWSQGDYNYYYVICNVRFSDGTFQRQGVPWPVRFPKTDDPFTGTAAGEKPLAMPLPGWHLGRGETVTPELSEYARANGVDLNASQ